MCHYRPKFSVFLPFKAFLCTVTFSLKFNATFLLKILFVIQCRPIFYLT